MTLIAALLPIVVVLVIALIGGFVLFGRRTAPEQPGLRASGEQTWNAEVLGGGVLGALGGTLGSTFGTFQVDAGALTFRPEGGPSAGWSVPCHELSVARRSVMTFDGADVRLSGPMGDLRCNVSVERINRMSRNDFKDRRQRRYAEEFAAVLLAHGARESG